jgi:tRNA 5-methylaminomethyl-2-thiouridine biosynthesis bifunctional protein
MADMSGDELSIGQMSAELRWREEDMPFSDRYSDFYFSAEDGLAEARHVFIQGNEVPSAWIGRSDFTIAETGFGTGLNFCATVQQWLETRPRNGLLHYVSVEGFPLSANDCLRALARWPELAPITARLRERYPNCVPGTHLIHFEEWGVILTLAIGEVGEMLSGLHGRVDAWFLDGFAPSRNPEMWREEVLAQVARLTVSGGSLATFTAAGSVRKKLTALGFDVRKVTGFGRKREMVVARRVRDNDACWPLLPAHAAPVRELSRRDRVAVIGGGIAGASLVRTLSRRGVTVTIYDGAGPGSGASGNPYALVMPRMDAGDGAAARFFAAAYRYAIAQYAESDGWDPCGLLVLLEDDAAKRRAEKAQGHAWHPAAIGTMLDRAEASEKVGVELDCPGLFYASAGLLRTDRLLREWIGGHIVVTAEIVQIRRLGNGFALMGQGGECVGEADAVILAAGDGNRTFAQAGWIPLSSVRGQISEVPALKCGYDLKCAVSWGGYLSPVRSGRHLLGATHDTANKIGADWAMAVLDEDHCYNYRNMPACLVNLVSGPDTSWSGRARLRSVTPDRVPLFGSVPEREVLSACFGKPLRRGRMRIPASDLMILGGLGSRGFVTAPLAAEQLIARMLGEVWPVEVTLGIAGDPARFAWRASRRGRLEEFLS